MDGIMIKKFEKISFEEVEMAEDQLSLATIPQILSNIRTYGKRRRTGANLQKGFVKAWLREADNYRMNTSDAVVFVEDCGIVPSKEIAQAVLDNTAIMPRGRQSLGIYTALNNDWWGDGHGSVKRFQVHSLRGKNEYGILHGEAFRSDGYIMQPAPRPIGI